mmetsp:Transcript_74180/g.241218  ORF Transcript_74180/g.241218 Transcript_74180/m.241218 type:complete len:280 (+) Transcript_74180:1605-2444(+)
MHHLPVPQQAAEASLRELLRQRLLTPKRKGTDVLDIRLRQESRLPGHVGQVADPVAELVAFEDDALIWILVRPVQVHIGQVAAGDRSRSLQQVVLPLPPLQRARSRWSVRVVVVCQLAHEGAPIDALVIEICALRLTLELRRPQKLDGLFRNVVACRSHGICELRFRDQVATLRVHFAKGFAQDLAIGHQAVHQQVGDVVHMPFLRLVLGATNMDLRSINQVRELFERDSTFAILVRSLDQQLALRLFDFNAHLVKHLLQVLGKDEAGLLQGAVSEDTD